MKDLEKFYRENFGIQSQNLLDWAIRHTTVRTLEKGEPLIHAGEPQRELCFLCSGVLRGLAVDKNGQDTTVCFSATLGDALIGGMDIQGNAPLNIEALEESEVVSLPVDAVIDRIRTDPEMAKIYNQLLVESGNRQIMVKTILCQGTATQRYDWFCKEYPGLIERINNRYAASYLGMTPVTFSRLRHGVATKDAQQKTRRRP